MKLKPVLITALALFAGHTLAAAPSATLNRSWSEYTGTQTIGNNKVQDDSSAYWVLESTGSWMGQAVQSWLVFWDLRSSSQLKGSISFDQDILFVHDDKAELQATAAFGKAGLSYDYSNNLVGLEGVDKSNTSWSANTLTLKWTASNPGDHVRIMTAVPEPGTYAMFAGGLLALGFMARRRRAV